jgi:hypothetical protein
MTPTHFAVLFMALIITALFSKGAFASCTFGYVLLNPAPLSPLDYINTILTAYRYDGKIRDIWRSDDGLTDTQHCILHARARIRSATRVLINSVEWLEDGLATFSRLNLDKIRFIYDGFYHSIEDSLDTVYIINAFFPGLQDDRLADIIKFHEEHAAMQALLNSRRSPKAKKALEILKGMEDVANHALAMAEWALEDAVNKVDAAA